MGDPVEAVKHQANFRHVRHQQENANRQLRFACKSLEERNQTILDGKQQLAEFRVGATSSLKARHGWPDSAITYMAYAPLAIQLISAGVST